MRIAYVSADLGVPVFGRKGCSIHVQEILRALGRRGAQVTLFSTCCSDPPSPGLEGVHLVSLARPPKGERAHRETASLALNHEWIEAIERHGPYDCLYERYSLWSYAGMEYARAARIPGLLEVNSPLIEEQATYRVLINRADAESVAHKVFGDATALLAVSDEVAGHLEQFPEAAGKVHVIPNGVDAGLFCLERKLSSLTAPETFTVGFVGTLKPWHGLSVLVEAFALLDQRCPEARLLIVGDGPEKENLDLSSRGLINKAHFTGAVAHSEVPPLLASMDVAVAPYPKLPKFYFSPLKVYEYMAAGLPVIASDVGQLRKLINHGVNGLLAPAGDAVALADALILLQNDPALRARLGRAARATILGKHTWDRVVDRILGVAGLDLPANPDSTHQVEAQPSVR